MNRAEAQFLNWAIHTAHGAGLLAHHALNRCPSCGLAYHTGDPGFPDLVLAGPGGLLIRELKSRTGIMQPAQKRWGRILAECGGGVAQMIGQRGLPPVWDVWRDPVDRLSGRVEHELKAIT